MAKSYTKIGAVLKNSKGDKFLVLGNSKSKNEKYNFQVDVRVTMADGTKKTFTNALVGIQDPRRREGADLSKISDKLVGDLVITSDE